MATMKQMKSTISAATYEKDMLGNSVRYSKEKVRQQQHKKMSQAEWDTVFDVKVCSMCRVAPTQLMYVQYGGQVIKRWFCTKCIYSEAQHSKEKENEVKRTPALYKRGKKK